MHKHFCPKWSGALTDVDVANKAFWPTIAKHGFAYNLLILEKVNSQKKITDFKNTFGAAWTADIAQLQEKGLLYAIDLRMYALLPISQVKGNTRYTPATLTLLAQNPDNKSLQPIAVALVVPKKETNVVYSFGNCTDSSWLYALLAVKTSVTLYGIWMGMSIIGTSFRHPCS